MGIVTGIVVFLLIWFVSLMMVLPFGHERNEDGTPVTPHIKKKFFRTTVMALMIWGMVFWLIESDLISFREMANTMADEDYGR